MKDREVRARKHLQHTGGGTFPVRKHRELERREGVGDAGSRNVYAVAAPVLPSQSAAGIGIRSMQVG